MACAMTIIDVDEDVRQHLSWREGVENMELTREQITEKRERLGLSKSAFGRESGLHVSTISQIESGRLIPYPGQMKKIVAAFVRLEKGQVR